MKLIPSTASILFTIFVKQGNMDGSEGYIEQKRIEFIESISTDHDTDGINEYWFPTKSGSSIKVYFRDFSHIPIVFHAQTLSTKDKGIIEAMTKATKALVGF